VAQLTTASNQVDKIVNRLKVLASLGDSASANDREEIVELSSRRNADIVECGRLLQNLGNHRAAHDC